jgi:RNA-binding protein
MDKIMLTGSQKSRLRGLGQRLEPSVRVGKEGLTAAILSELKRQLGARELVKLRFAGIPREERAALCPKLSEATGSAFVGAVGQTALFFIPSASPEAKTLVKADDGEG